MNIVNQKIIDAVIAKSEKVCPDSLALIGVYGSVATGDEYDKSDLDLLILIQNDDGWKLGTGFILNDSSIGYDIYCTNWEGLQFDAECHHAHLSKLLDSEIVYVKNQQAILELSKLREQTRAFLNSEKRFQRVHELLEKAKVSYANSQLHANLGSVRMDAFEVVNCLLDALMIYHGAYFKRGVKRTFEELAMLPVSEEFSDCLRKISASNDILEMRALLKNLLLYVENQVRQHNQKEEPSETLSGTYEEMYSNWRNKVEESAKRHDVFSAFMNMCSLQSMFSDISSEVNIGTFNMIESFNPDCLEENVKLFDKQLAQYEEVYKRAGITVKRFSNVDAFVADFLGGNNDGTQDESETGAL